MGERTQEPSLDTTSLPTHVVGSRLLVYDRVASTNDVALEVGGNGTVVVANVQNEGRGRHGRRWHSASGLGLWFSVVLEEELDGLPFAAVLAARDGLRPWCDARVKWPNDLVVDGRKVCGVLVEQRQGRTVLGIGINVHHQPEDFPEEVRGTAGSIEMFAKRPCNRAELLEAVLIHLDERVIVLRKGGSEVVWREWRDACNLEGCKIRHGNMEGTVSAMEPSGALVVATAQGARTIAWGEIVEMNGA